MIDFTKAYCSLHPHELVTNFCNKEDECLIALCANCICTHTESHVQKGTCPDYENIRTTYKKIQDNLTDQINSFENQKDRIDKVAGKIEQKRRKLKDIIEMARDQTISFIHHYFEEKEKKMLRQIQTEEKKRGLHCESRLQSLASFIERQISSLINASQEITSSNFLESLPRVRTQVIPNSRALFTQIQEQLNQNEQFTTTLTYDSSYLNAFENLLEKSLQLVYSKSIPKKDEEIRRQGLFGSKIARNAKSQVNFGRSVAGGFYPKGQIRVPPQEKVFFNDLPKQNFQHHFINQTPNFHKTWGLESEKHSPPRLQMTYLQPGVKQDPKISLIKVAEGFKDEDRNRIPSNARKEKEEISKTFEKQGKLAQSNVDYTLRNVEEKNGLRYSSNLGRKGKKVGLKVMGNTFGETQSQNQSKIEQRFYKTNMI